MIKIIEDFLPEDIQNNLEELMKNESYFPWYFHSKTVGLGECAFNNNTIETPTSSSNGFVRNILTDESTVAN